MADLSLPGELVEDAALVVSESVTNAVTHACSTPRLCVSIADSRLLVEVHDASRAPPELRAPTAAGGGQGLRIIDAVADACGWSPTSTGKVVWAELRILEPASTLGADEHASVTALQPTARLGSDGGPSGPNQPGADCDAMGEPGRNGRGSRSRVVRPQWLGPHRRHHPNLVRATGVSPIADHG
jgi:hypothetical protein